MKKIFYFILAGLTIAGCATKEATTAVDPASLVDLRYRVGKTVTNDIDSRYTEETSTYDIESDDPDPIALVVKSSKPWSIRSTHPTWCTIDVEGGQAVADSLVHLGKGENTPIIIKYYDNHNLDDRLDTLIIYSDYWIGKKIFVNQAGIAYLDVENKTLSMAKNGSEVVLNVLSNQKWSAKIQESKGDKWLSIKEGTDTGEGNGQVVLVGEDNAGEEREAVVRIYDRHGNKMRWYVTVKQAGISLNPIGAIETDEDEYEVRGLYDQEEIAFDVVANSEWTAVKQKESDTWFSFADADPTYPGNATLRIKLTESNLSVVREAFIILKTTGETKVSKKIKVRQAYKMQPVRHNMNDDSYLSKWYNDGSGEWDGSIELKAVETGVLMPSNLYMRYDGSVPISGTHTFRFGNIQDDANIRGWFYWRVNGEGSKYLKLELDRNGTLGSPYVSALDGTYDVQDYLEITLTNTLLDNGFFHVALTVNGVDKGTFDSSEDLFPLCVAGGTIGKLVFGVQGGGSAVMEWYEYLAPFSWE